MGAYYQDGMCHEWNYVQYDRLGTYTSSKNCATWWEDIDVTQLARTQNLRKLAWSYVQEGSTKHKLTHVQSMNYIMDVRSPAIQVVIVTQPTEPQ
jgi:hypothetical protein